MAVDTMASSMKSTFPLLMFLFLGVVSVIQADDFTPTPTDEAHFGATVDPATGDILIHLVVTDDIYKNDYWTKFTIMAITSGVDILELISGDVNRTDLPMPNTLPDDPDDTHEIPAFHIFPQFDIEFVSLENGNPLTILHFKWHNPPKDLIEIEVAGEWYEVRKPIKIFTIGSGFARSIPPQVELVCNVDEVAYRGSCYSLQPLPLTAVHQTAVEACLSRPGDFHSLATAITSELIAAIKHRTEQALLTKYRIKSNLKYGEVFVSLVQDANSATPGENWKYHYQTPAMVSAEIWAPTYIPWKPSEPKDASESWENNTKNHGRIETKLKAFNEADQASGMPPAALCQRKARIGYMAKKQMNKKMTNPSPINTISGTLNECAMWCCAQPHCLSMDYGPMDSSCYFYTANSNDVGVSLAYMPNVNHYDKVSYSFHI